MSTKYIEINICNNNNNIHCIQYFLLSFSYIKCLMNRLSFSQFQDFSGEDADHVCSKQEKQAMQLLSINADKIKMGVKCSSRQPLLRQLMSPGSHY